MISAFNSQKFRFWSFVSMVLLVFVHGYNLNESYLQPWTQTGEPLSLTTFTEYFLANGIFRFRIPMLFIISGYLYSKGDDIPNKNRMGKRIRTLLFPYLLWSAASLLCTFLLELSPFWKTIVMDTHLAQIDGSRTLIHQYEWYEVVARWIFFPVSYQLWFIRVLLIYNLSYPFLRWCIYHKTAKWVLFTIAILMWLSTANLILLDGEGLLFFTLGIWIQKTGFNIDTPNKWLQPKFWAVIFLTFSVAKTLLAFQSPFAGIEIIMTISHKIVVIAGLITAWFGCNIMVENCMNRRWFVHYSAFAFFIYVLHAPMVNYATKAIFIYVHHFQYYRLLTFFVLPTLIVFVCIGIAAMLRATIPGIYRFLTGGRGL